MARKGYLFAVGGGAYVGLELLYRGRSHISMFAAGGACFLLLGKIRQAHKKESETMKKFHSLAETKFMRDLFEIKI